LHAVTRSRNGDDDDDEFGDADDAEQYERRRALEETACMHANLVRARVVVCHVDVRACA
jgi:hypothetical protein